MAKPYVTLQPTEQALLTAAATIYSGYLAAGKVPEGQEDQWMDRAMQAAFRMCRVIDASVQADKEID
jgi:hypothetical protein